ncbi:MAG: ComEA family DNA-binding protein [Chloroflexi bacterium]|nr:ComEA family DNA-binding protein [Chloroflexota bacterium]
MSFLRRHRGYILLSLAWLIALGSVLFVVKRPQPAPLEILPPPPTVTPAPTPTPRPLRVYVSGAVQAPDVYELPADSIIEDAIGAAGGATDDADLEAINQALSLSDGMQVHVPRRQENSPTPPVVSVPLLQTTSGFSSGPAGRVNINTATAEELDTLPGIGPAMAQRIIEGRPYGSIEDIMRVKGIGEATFEKLKDLIAVQ